MKVNVKRFDPDTGLGRVDSYEVPTDQRTMTVMDVLDYIGNNLDPTLAYYQHSVCNHGICGRCSLSVNGNVRLACIEVANQYEELNLAPMPTRPVIRDLVTRK